MNNDLMIRESGAIATLTAEQRKELFDKFILSGDVSGYSEAEKVGVLLTLCDKYDFDPIQRPFDVIRLPDGRAIIYANKTAAAIVSVRECVSLKIVDRTFVGDSYVVTVTATNNKGRSVDDDGVVALAGTRKDGTSYRLTGDMLTNKMMHATTKAKRRATLSIGGLGFLSDAEAESMVEAGEAVVEEVNYAIVDPHAEAVAMWQAKLDECSNVDELTATHNLIMKLSDAVRESLRQPKIDAITRIGCVWRKDRFWPVAEAVEA